MNGKRLYGETGHSKLGAKYARRVERFARKLVADAIRDGVDTRDLTLLAFNSTQIMITMAALKKVCERRERKAACR